MLVWAAALACRVDPVDLSGRPCPCAPGWICESAQNVCVLEPPNEGAVSVSNLRATWTTPNAIFWEWDSEGSPDQLRRFELLVGPSEAAVAARSEGVVIFTEAQNPELGRFLLPRVGGEDPVRSTITDLHQPDTLYFAQLIATDITGKRWATGYSSARTTLAPTQEIVVFSEDQTAGFSVPAELIRSSEAPYQGSWHYQYTKSCGSGGSCFENLRRMGMAIPLVRTPTGQDLIREGDYLTTAFIELAVANEARSASFWSEVWLAYGNCLSCSTRSCRYAFHPFTIRPGGAYRLIQVPLRVLEAPQGPAPYGQLSQGLCEFNLGGLWESNAPVRIDGVRIRW